MPASTEDALHDRGPSARRHPPPLGWPAAPIAERSPLTGETKLRLQPRPRLAEIRSEETHQRKAVRVPLRHGHRRTQHVHCGSLHPWPPLGLCFGLLHPPRPRTRFLRRACPPTDAWLPHAPGAAARTPSKRRHRVGVSESSPSAAPFEWHPETSHAPDLRTPQPRDSLRGTRRLRVNDNVLAYVQSGRVSAKAFPGIPRCLDVRSGRREVGDSSPLHHVRVGGGSNKSRVEGLRVRISAAANTCRWVFETVDPWSTTSISLSARFRRSNLADAK